MGMAEWRARIVKKGRGSQTPGKTKGGNCVRTFLQNWYAKNSRSYKDPGYRDWCDSMDRRNKVTR